MIYMPHWKALFGGANFKKIQILNILPDLMRNFYL